MCVATRANEAVSKTQEESFGWGVEGRGNPSSVWAFLSCSCPSPAHKLTPRFFLHIDMVIVSPAFTFVPQTERESKLKIFSMSQVAVVQLMDIVHTVTCVLVSTPPSPYRSRSRCPTESGYSEGEQTIYQWTVRDYGDPTKLAISPWSFMIEPVMAAVTATVRPHLLVVVLQADCFETTIS